MNHFYLDPAQHDYAASVQSWTDEISGLVFIFFQPSGWQFDI